MSDTQVKAFFDQTTYTVTYVVSDPATSKCAIIDSVLDYDPDSGRTSSISADQVINYLKSEKLDCEWILETHVHADHLSAAPYLKEKLGGKTAIGENVALVQKTFAPIFNAEESFAKDGRQFDHRFTDASLIIALRTGKYSKLVILKRAYFIHRVTLPPVSVI